MKKLIKAIEKMKPFFDAVARNVYLKSIKDGFISCMPIVIFSSIFLLVAYVPNIFGFHWSANIEAILMKPYNYSMGILAVAVSATTAKHFTDSLNRNMPENNQINSLSTMVCSIICFLMLSADSIKDGFANGYMGSKGLLTAFLTEFIVSVSQETLRSKCQNRYHQTFPRHLKISFHLDLRSSSSGYLIYYLELM